ncbi:Rid family hydrolase [Roseovarius atlanticus]|uniref:Rid family hydrolase n=1 Tax=Roseovarius atlanticus TaxID=1641875 RepID=UPI001C952227|nr:Rid family hydrolase [Roseovarius atlanticus]MBY5989161.1 hypothetical protein [Roseovarius atlanticus]MBY6124553.1 hypothetical protein [Roseovarius atlanticus]MBY6149048.1 hypothetical protein [Roseovarius atlanticus]
MTRPENVNARYAQVLRHEGLIFVAGQVSKDLSRGFADQAHDVMRAVDDCLAQAGGSGGRLLSVTVYLRDVEDVPHLNEVWDRWLSGRSRPVRTLVSAKLWHPDCRIEASAVGVA